MDANGRMSGDIGYDPSTEQGSGSNLDANGYAPGDKMYNGGSSSGGKVGTAPTDAELWLRDHPAQEMAPLDFSSAPGWWNKGSSSPAGKVGGGQTPMESARPNYSDIANAPSQPSAGRMIDYIGNVGGQTGITGTSPLSTALRGAVAGAGGE